MSDQHAVAEKERLLTRPATTTGPPGSHHTPLSEPFWDGCARGELRVQECTGCGFRFLPPENACRRCLGRELAWVTSPGMGTVHTFTLVHRPSEPSLEVPYAIAVVELDDGWSMMTNVVDCRPEDVHIGMRVAVTFRAGADSQRLPCFAPLS